MLKLLKFFRPYLLWSLALVLSTLILVWASVQVPTLLIDIINHGVIAGDMDYIVGRSLLMGLYSAIDAIFLTITRMLAIKISKAIRYDLQEVAIAKVLSFGAAEISHFSVASLINRTNKDTSAVATFFHNVISFVLWSIVSVIMVIWQSLVVAPHLMWTILVSSLLISLAVFVIAKISLPKIKLWRKLNDKITAITRENITGAKVIRAFNRQAHEQERLAKVNQESLKAALFIDRIYSFEDPIINFIFLGMTVLIMWLGANYAATNLAYIGILMAFMRYAEKVTHSFLAIIFIFSELPRALVSARRVNEILTANPAVEWQSATAAKIDQIPSVEFRHVKFRFPDAKKPLLKDISFIAKAGETTAIVGSTGSGKTTIANLILRLHDVTDGSILVSGVDVRDYAKSDLMDQIGYVPQKGVLFIGTISDNIKFGAPSATAAEVEAAAKIAMADEFIRKLPKGYQSKVDIGGKNFSGGQKQRLSIARALVRRPRILIFDDAFSALDLKTDVKLRKALAPVIKNSVNIIVAQRVNTIKNAQQIVVLDGGLVVGSGTHLQLLKTCATYREIVSSQMTADDFAIELQAAGVKNV